MTAPQLISQPDALRPLVQLFIRSNEPMTLEVCEEQCFKDQWLGLGRVRAFPYQGRDDGYGELDRKGAMESALRSGAYSWRLPELREVIEATKRLLGEEKTSPEPEGSRSSGADARRSKAEKVGKIRSKVERALEAVSYLAMRCGLVHPVFDAGELVTLPPMRPVTVIPDTNAILQGALDFAARFLGPKLRIKLPSVAHLEILNHSDNFLTGLRKACETYEQRTTQLFEHVRSQAGQRALLRLALHSGAEVDRLPIGMDPLRGLVSLSPDETEKQLEIRVLVRSYADRLIIESALRQRELGSSDESIAVLTGDQGVARMALAEGLRALYFASVPAESVFGREFIGTVLHPFQSNRGNPLHRFPLSSLLWELGTTFGAARLVTADASASFTVRAIGKTLPWMPYHAHEDLMWAERDGLPAATDDVVSVFTSARDSSVSISVDTSFSDFEKEAPPRRSRKSTKSHPSYPDTAPPKEVIPDRSESESGTDSITTGASKLHAAYAVQPERLISLVSALMQRRRISESAGMKIVKVTSDRWYRNYRNFLVAGGFVSLRNDALEATERLNDLWGAIISPGQSLEDAFRRVPSFDRMLGASSVGKPFDAASAGRVGINKDAFLQYAALAELALAGLHVPRSGFFRTPNKPTLREFARIALTVFEEERRADPDVLTGRWLESLAERHGIHPVRARELLEEANAAGTLERYVEGSSPATGLMRAGGQRNRDGLMMHVFERTADRPEVVQADLYDGRFLLPEGRASVRLRLVKGLSWD